LGWGRPFIALTVAATTILGSEAAVAVGNHDFWPFNRNKVEEVVPDPFPYTATLTVQGDDRRLTRQLKRASNLIGQQKTPPSGLAGLLARARQDRFGLTAVLYENALYAGEIAVTVDGQPVDAIGPFDPLSPPATVDIVVTPGAPFVFGYVDARPLPAGITLEKLGIASGEPANSQIIIAAEAAIVDGWRQQGYPLARAGPRDTIADHGNNTLDVVFNINPGPIADFGPVTVVGAVDVNQQLIVGRAGLNGGLYSSKKARKAEERLRDLGVFQTVRIAPADYVNPDGTVPMTITVSERKRHVIGATVAYSNTEGLGVEGFWRNRNLWGGAESLELSAGISRLLSDTFDPDYRLAGKFTKPGVFDPMTDFTLRVERYRETTDEYRVTPVET
jgi:translocation and assembly module TamA